MLQKFYWNGIKLINVNRKHVHAIQARVRGGEPLSRWETRFIANYKRDALKWVFVSYAEVQILPVREGTDSVTGSSRLS